MTNKPLPKYLQLKREILEWLKSGRWKPDEQMPSEHEIAQRFGMSRQTVRQTLGELENEGWLYRVQGKGTFVSRPPVDPPAERTTVGMLTTYISEYIFPHIVRGAEAQLRRNGCSLLLSSTDNDKSKEKEQLMMLLEQPLRGLIIEPTKSAQGNPNLSYYLSLQYRGIPFVMINERYPELNCPCVKVNDEAGGFKAAEHVLRLGHTRVAGFFKTDDLQGVNRLKGFLRAHRRYGVPLAPERVVHYSTEEKEDKPFAAALEMLKRPDRPTAFVCYNDELAIRLLEAARQSGMSVPSDLSVVGFDDSSLATATEVKLTTLTHPKSELGVRAAETLLRLMERSSNSGDADNEGTAQDELVVYEPELVVRNSTAEWKSG